MRPELAAPAVVLLGVLALQGLGSAALLPALVAATFVTRLRIELAGHNFLLEHVLVLALLLSLILEGRARELARAAEDRTVILLGCFVAWEAAVSLLAAPDPAQSLSIVGWLLLDWLLLISVTTAVRSRQLERLAVGSSTALAGVATALWLAFLLGGATLGTQGGVGSGYENDARAVFGLSWEANILASTVAVWAFVAISSDDRWVRRIARLAVPLAVAAIAASLTRAAILGLGAGLLVWIALDGSAAMQRAARWIGAVVGLALVTATLVPQAVAPVQARLDHLVSFGEGSGALRRDAADAAIGDLHGEAVLTGLGVDSFGQRHEDPTRPGEPWYLGMLPLQVLYEGGLVGIAILAAAVASLQPLGRRHRGRALGVMTVYVAAAAATSPFWFGSTWLLIALAILTRPRTE